MKNQARYEKLMNESRERIEMKIVENKKNSAIRFVKILNQMVTFAERKENVIVLDRKLFDKIERLSK